VARPRVEATRLRELVRLRREGVSGREIARLLRMSPKTERRYRGWLAEAGLLEGAPKALPSALEIRAAVLRLFPIAAPQPSTVDPWGGQVRALFAKGLGARAVYDRLRLEPPEGLPRYQGSYSAVRRYVRRLKREAGTEPGDVAITIPTTPGEEAQVDFGYAGRLYDPSTGTTRRAWVFVMVLCHSRHFFARLVFDQRTETWLSLHEQAFLFFGGVVGTVVPDNTKRAVLRAAFGLNGETELERSYRELARAWGFRIDPAPPGAPRKRGKVEATVKYLRNNPLKGRDGEPLPEVQRALDQWIVEVASVRVHGTTRRRPLEVFTQEEAGVLRPLPRPKPPRVVWKHAKVHPDSHVTCRGRLFSVPWQLIHEHVWVRACGQEVRVHHRDKCVARHVDQGQRRTTVDEHLPADRRDLRRRGREFWERRAAKVGQNTRALVVAVFDQDDVLSYLRTVQAIVKHLEQFPQGRAEAASLRAVQKGDLTYRAVKTTLSEGLDLLGDSPAMSPANAPSPPPDSVVACASCGAHALQPAQPLALCQARS